jgi:hypothetical protein
MDKETTRIDEVSTRPSLSLHPPATQLGFDYIAVGNVSASKLARTRMAKSVCDDSRSSFRYKAIARSAIGAMFEEVNESGFKDSTTQPERYRRFADEGVDLQSLRCCT